MSYCDAETSLGLDLQLDHHTVLRDCTVCECMDVCMWIVWPSRHIRDFCHLIMQVLCVSFVVAAVVKSLIAWFSDGTDIICKMKESTPVMTHAYYIRKITSFGYLVAIGMCALTVSVRHEYACEVLWTRHDTTWLGASLSSVPTRYLLLANHKILETSRKACQSCSGAQRQHIQQQWVGHRRVSQESQFVSITC